MQIQISATSIPGSDAPNEDYYLASNTWAIVLDGITRYPNDGCIHDVPWYVRQLGSAIASQIENQDRDLHAVLKQAIETTSNRHRDTCDLENPVTPGATVTIVRVMGEQIEWLVLGDSAVAWRTTDGKVHSRSDERLSQLTNMPPTVNVDGIRRLPINYITEVRNLPGGFWVASSDPTASEAALSGAVKSMEVHEIGLFTDGTTRLFERFNYERKEIFDLAADYGVSAITSLVREEEMRGEKTHLSSKPHDDATAVLLKLHTGSHHVLDG